MLSFLKKLASTTVANYVGDKAFLNGAASAVANVTAADGKIEDSEIEAGITGMKNHEILAKFYSTSEIEEAISAALNRAKTRAGRMENKRFIEALVARPVETRTDIFLIAADVADNDGIGAEEQKVLDDIAGLLRVDGHKLLAA